VIYALLRERLPKYMVPAYLEHLDAIPMTPQDKADRKNLPPPGQRTTARRRASTWPPRPTPSAAGRRDGQDAGVADVSVDSHFFDELGASSLLMAQFTAAGAPGVRAAEDLHARHLPQPDDPPAGRRPRRRRHPDRRRPEPGLGAIEVVAKPIVRASTAGYLLCGAAQLAVLLAAAYLGGLVLKIGLDWTMGGAGLSHIAGRAAVFCTATLLGAVALPILVKWLLIDDWKAREIRLWSAGYLRFWLVKY